MGRNLHIVLVTILAAEAGRAAIWHTAHFYSLKFLTATLDPPPPSACAYLVGH